MAYPYDYLIVGAGLFGTVFARQMTDAGKCCIVIDRRNHIAGSIQKQWGCPCNRCRTSSSGVWWCVYSSTTIISTTPYQGIHHNQRSREPIVFSEARRQGWSFIYVAKFRSMIVSAEKDG